MSRYSRSAFSEIRLYPATRVAILLVLLIANRSWSQTPIPDPPSFEVASVRHVSAGRGYTSISPEGAVRFTATNVSMKVLIQLAFGVDDDQLAGQISWLDSEFYDVEAKPVTDHGLTHLELRPLLQDLLIKRFDLAVHHETKEVSGYALEVAKNGPRLTTGDAIAMRTYILPDGITSPGASMKTLAALLAHPVGKPVVDRTGLTGTYEIKLKFAPIDSLDSSLPSIFTALQEQLGLRLEKQKVPLAVLVVDKLNKLPSPN